MTYEVDVTLTSLVLNPWDGNFATGDKIALSYADLDFTPSASDPYKSTSGDVFKVYIGGTRIYRSSDQQYASGSGFLEDGDISGQKLNGQTGTAWTATSDNVWTIETANQRILLDKSEVEATSLYGSGGLAVNIATDVIIELRRAVQDLKTTAVDFSNASILTEQDLDNSAKNVFHVAQQAIITTENALLYDSGTDTYNAYQPGTTTNKRIANVDTPTAANDAANKTYVDGSSNTVTVATNIVNVNHVAGQISPTNNISTVAGSVTAGHIATVAGDAVDIGKVAGKEAEIGRLGSTDYADGADAYLAKLGADAFSNATNGYIKKVADIDSNVTTVAGVSGNVTTVATNIDNVNAVALSIAGSQTYTVTVTNPGSGNVFVLDGNNNPAITLTKGFTYTFDQSDASNSGHTLKIRDDDDNEYTNGVTLTGTPGSAGAKTVFTVPANAPTTGLRYYCVAHGESMGNTITTANNDLGEVASIGAANLNTVATNAESNAIEFSIALG